MSSKECNNIIIIITIITINRVISKNRVNHISVTGKILIFHVGLGGFEYSRFLTEGVLIVS